MKLRNKYILAVIMLTTSQWLFVSNAYSLCDSERLQMCRYGYTRDTDDVIKCDNRYTTEHVGYVEYQAANSSRESLIDKLNHYKKEASIASNDKDRRYFPLMVCLYTEALSRSKSSGTVVSSESNQASSPESTSTNDSSSNQQSQQNSSPEEIERTNVRNYSAQQTAAYQEKYKGRGKKHNLDAFANRCIKTKGRKVLNTCNFDVEVVFCAKNPDPNSKHAFEMANGFDCARNSKGMWGISANSALMGVFTADSVSVFACKKPSLPGAEVDPQTLSLVGRCSEY